MNVGNGMVMLALALASAGSSQLIGSIIGITLPGTGVSVAPGTIVSGGALTLSGGSSNFQSNYTTPSQTTFSAPFVTTGANATFTMTAYADAGVFKGDVDETVNSGEFPVTGIIGDAASFMEDTLTISDPSLNGTVGSLALGFSLDATGTATQAFNTNGIGTFDSLEAYAGSPIDGLPPYSSFSFETSIATSYSGPKVSFTYGQPVSIELWFEASAGVGCESVAACTPWTGLPVSVSDNASDTAILNSLTVYDSKGNPIPSSDWSVTAASGLDYTANGIVPEPSSYGLLGLTLGLLGVVGRWRRRGIRTN